MHVASLVRLTPVLWQQVAMRPLKVIAWVKGLDLCLPSKSSLFILCRLCCGLGGSALALDPCETASDNLVLPRALRSVLRPLQCLLSCQRSRNYFSPADSVWACSPQTSTKIDYGLRKMEVWTLSSCR